MVFPNNDYNNSALAFSNGEYTFTHSAYGADMFHYSLDFGQTWTNWTNWEDTTKVNTSFFADATMFWDGMPIFELLLRYYRTTVIEERPWGSSVRNYLSEEELGALLNYFAYDITDAGEAIVNTKAL